jgi:hypothetical protein
MLRWTTSGAAVAAARLLLGPGDPEVRRVPDNADMRVLGVARTVAEIHGRRTSLTMSQDWRLSSQLSALSSLASSGAIDGQAALCGW